MILWPAIAVYEFIDNKQRTKHKLVAVKGKKSEADGQENLKRMKSADVIRRFYCTVPGAAVFSKWIG